MHPGARLATIAAMTTGLGLAAAFYGRHLVATIDPQPVASTSPPAWRYPNEQSWIVGETLGHIAGLAHFARTGTVAPPAVIDWTVQDRRPAAPTGIVFEAIRRDGVGAREEVAFSDHVFSPEGLRPVASRWLGDAKPSGASSSVDTIQALTDLRLEVLVATARQVSSALTQDPRSAATQEDAAFVLAAFALREAAAGHTDPRGLLTRITAHLTLASALRGTAEPSLAGRLADVCLSVLTGRQAEAVEKLDRLPPAGGAAEASWRTALRMRATRDWRLARWSADLGLVEQLAWFRAADSRRSGDRAYEWLEQLPPARRDLPDWGRIRLSAAPSVQDCHAFAVHGSLVDMAEARRAAALFGRGALDDTRLVAELNVRPRLDPVVVADGTASVEVLDWGTVASFIQRHLGARLSYEAACYERIFGLQQETETVVLAQESAYGALTLFPLEAHRWVKTPAVYKRFADASARVLLEHPELPTAHQWARLLDPNAFGTPPDVPKDTSWFDPPFPFGTFLPETTRLFGPSPARHVGAEAFEALIRLDPFDTSIRWSLATRRHGPTPPYERLKEEYGPALEWDLRSMNSLGWLSTTPPAEKRRWLTTVCEMDGEYCSSLGRFLADEHDDVAAAQAYRRYWKGGMDRVAVANRMGWLVEYDRTHGREKEAWEVAEDSAATYSGSGLTTLADLAEKTKRFDVAEENYRKVAERYDSPEVLYEFYTRRVEAGQARFESDRAALVKRLFPDGFQPLDGVPTGRPTDGVVLTSADPKIEQACLRKDDVLVALDGTRIRNRPQLVVVSHRSAEPEMRFLVHRAGAYVDLRCRFEGRKIPGQMATYPPRR